MYIKKMNYQSINYKSSSSDSDIKRDCFFFFVSMSELSSSDEYILLLSTEK